MLQLSGLFDILVGRVQGAWSKGLGVKDGINGGSVEKQ